MVMNNVHDIDQNHFLHAFAKSFIGPTLKKKTLFSLLDMDLGF